MGFRFTALTATLSRHVSGLTCSFGFEGVPHVAVEVIVAGQQQASALGEGH